MKKLNFSPSVLSGHFVEQHEDFLVQARRQGRHQDFQRQEHRSREQGGRGEVAQDQKGVFRAEKRKESVGGCCAFGLVGHGQCEVRRRFGEN
jgi:hypothetical protein